MKRSNSSLEKELAHLKSSLNGLEILLEQNQRLEEHVERLCEESETATNNVVKRGYLYKWRDKEIACNKMGPLDTSLYREIPSVITQTNRKRDLTEL